MPQIDISVHETDQGSGERAGTFIHPKPKVRVATNANVNFNLVNGAATFEVRFRGFKSPFKDGAGNPILSIDNKNPGPFQAVVPGIYHYAIKVQKTGAGGATFVIDDCPEIEVGP